MRHLYGEDFHPEEDAEMLDKVLWELKRSYMEGYNDRLKGEAKSPETDTKERGSD